MMPDQDQDTGWPALPTETEIYILPNGEVVIADLPAELAAALQRVAPAAPPVSQAGEDGAAPIASGIEPDPHHVAD